MPEIKGWCPGALAPMASGDGLLMRAKVVGSKLTLTQAKEIAAISAACGNGLLDLSQRAQLQIRGVSEATIATAQKRLALVGLLAPDAATEAVTNVIASPLRSGSFDVDKFATRLGGAIAKNQALQQLPGKFLFLVDNGGSLGLSQSDADIRLESHCGGVAVVVDGARNLASLCKFADAIDAALALARAFLKLRAERSLDARRMRALVASIGAPDIFREAGLAPTPYRSLCLNGAIGGYLGAHVIDGICFAGVGAPFGRLGAGELSRLIEACEREGASELRLTPWRALLAPVASPVAAARIEEAARKLGFISHAEDRRLAIVACPGAPECPQALGPTRAGLDALTSYAQSAASAGVGLHVSGCAKGCARPSPAPITLVANGAGFDLIANGRASDAPLATGSLSDVASLLAATNLREPPWLAR